MVAAPLDVEAHELGAKKHCSEFGAHELAEEQLGYCRFLLVLAVLVSYGGVLSRHVRLLGGGMLCVVVDCE